MAYQSVIFSFLGNRTNTFPLLWNYARVAESAHPLSDCFSTCLDHVSCDSVHVMCHSITKATAFLTSSIVTSTFLLETRSMVCQTRSFLNAGSVFLVIRCTRLTSFRGTVSRFYWSYVHSVLCLFVQPFACPFERCNSIPCPSRFRPCGSLSCPVRFSFRNQFRALIQDSFKDAR